MTQYAYFDGTVSGVAPVLGWYDTDVLNYPNLPTASNLLELTPDQWAGRLVDTSGWAVNGGELVAYIRPAPVLTLAQQAAAAASAGCQILSTAAPALNGTYACDADTLASVTALQARINAGLGLPLGNNTVDWPDMAGAAHAFTSDQFTALVRAVSDYAYQLDMLVRGQGAALPAQPVTIA